MRPIIFAALLAIGIHGLFLGMEFDCLKKKYVRMPETRAITMTLTYFVSPRPNPFPRGGEGRVRGRRPQVIEKLSKAQKRPVISKKMVSAPAKPDKVIFEDIDDKYRLKVLEIMDKIRKIVTMELFPKVKKGKKCFPCECYKLCWGL